MRTVAQIQDEIRTRTEACMDEKKNNNNVFMSVGANRERWRGQCEGYARADLGDELNEAQEAEAVTLYTVNDATTRLAKTAGQKNNSVYLIIGAALAALALYLLLA